MNQFEKLMSWLRKQPGKECLDWTIDIVTNAVSISSHIGGLSTSKLQQRIDTLPPEYLIEDDQLGEYLATIQELSERQIGLRPHSVQLQAAAAMLRGTSIELATGEGKTLVGAIVAIGLVKAGRNVHILAANDYLAERDAHWMSPLFQACSVPVRSITSHSTSKWRRDAYNTSAVYVPVTEAGFDVLRDRLRLEQSELVGIHPDAAVLDEADAVLLDEGRVPLVLAGESTVSDKPSRMLAHVISQLVEDTDYVVDADRRTVHLTDAGLQLIDMLIPGKYLFGVDTKLLYQLSMALDARALLIRDVDYIIEDDCVRLISQSRGRIDALQRWPDGLQEAIEAKEHLSSSSSGTILDQLVMSDLLCLYTSVVGMSATLASASEELLSLYRLPVGTVPPNVPCIRVDEPDRLYSTVYHRNAAAVTFIRDLMDIGQPVLVGTQSVAESEHFGEVLKSKQIPCVILNAKNDADEAAVIAQAGFAYRVTVSTQMAGRGTDVRLDKIAKTLGGLVIVGLGRFPSSRLDEQLRGRSGRQGDPGRSVFFTSLEDDLITRYTPEHRPPKDVDSSGRVHDRFLRDLTNHAQRVAEGQEQSLRDLSKRYGRLISIYRARILKLRKTILESNQGTAILTRRIPQRMAEFRSSVGQLKLATVSRRVILLSLDAQWSSYLDYAAAVREGIHLRRLAREDPLLAYERLIAEAAENLIDDALKNAAQAMSMAHIDNGEIVVGEVTFYRPGATWTYMVTDDHFGTELERAGKAIVDMLRGRRQGHVRV